MNKTMKQPRALDNAEMTGWEYEQQVWDRLRQCKIGRVYEKTHHQCKIPISESLVKMGFGPWQHADGFLPDTGDGAGTYVEVKSGAKNETDSIDKKYVGDLVMFSDGWYGLTNENSLFGKPSMVLYIFAGQKERSAYTLLFMKKLAEARVRGEPWAKYVRAIRHSEMNTEKIAALVGPITKEGLLAPQPLAFEEDLLNESCHEKL
tara:strand:- start:129 stop:743 length:615 start_codon:yes stop_codon:yes gene_type:complete